MHNGATRHHIQLVGEDKLQSYLGLVESSLIIFYDFCKS